MNKSTNKKSSSSRGAIKPSSAIQMRRIEMFDDLLKPETTAKWKCRGCGCTDKCACAGGCAWIEKNLCGRCVAFADNFTPAETAVLHKALAHHVFDMRNYSGTDSRILARPIAIAAALIKRITNQVPADKLADIRTELVLNPVHPVHPVKKIHEPHRNSQNGN